MEWVKIEDDLPDNEDIVLVCDKLNEFVSLGRYLEEEDGIYQFELMHIDRVEIDSFITHWMPLPNPPKE